MHILRKKNNEYTVQELKTYKEHTSIFGNFWIDLHQERGMTKYIHFIYIQIYERVEKTFRGFHNNAGSR